MFKFCGFISFKFIVIYIVLMIWVALNWQLHMEVEATQFSKYIRFLVIEVNNRQEKYFLLRYKTY